ncbi:unnamed protein product [Spirodela intermedia]|uniref:Uncharacterized protein n=1 Tax=Spirodela intermedia TaxID=51605 RepID=A0A7I8JJ75_SPIIN|nr:unnamed protein product [Spirodela intermedia]CAA6669462.1 unnamed protein product [Spirodela intermedia]
MLAREVGVEEREGLEEVTAGGCTGRPVGVAGLDETELRLRPPDDEGRRFPLQRRLKSSAPVRRVGTDETILNIGELPGFESATGKRNMELKMRQNDVVLLERLEEKKQQDDGSLVLLPIFKRGSLPGRVSSSSELLLRRRLFWRSFSRLRISRKRASSSSFSFITAPRVRPLGGCCCWGWCWCFCLRGTDEETVDPLSGPLKLRLSIFSPLPG